MNSKRGVNVLILMLAVIMVAGRFISPFTNMITWDVFGYYLYLPALFIYDDLFLASFEWLSSIINQYEPTATLYQAVKIENGNWIMKYSMGMAVIFSPFFFIAHLLSGPLGYASDGFSTPYQVSLVLGGMLYAVVGLVYFSKILQHFFTYKVVAIVLVLIVLGTNYFQLTVFDGTLLSHNILFTLYALLIWNTIQWDQNQKHISAVFIGFLCGLITLIRPSEVICIVIPVLWGVYDIPSIKLKWKLIIDNVNQWILAVFMAIIVGLPQLIYWKLASGSWFFYSYTNAGEGFEFLSPYTWSYLFSFRKGWFIYTPIMLFSILGMYHLYQKKLMVFWAIAIFFFLDLWIVSSWTTWWYAGGSFSARSMVPAYVLLAIPLGYIVNSIFDGKGYIKNFMFLIFSLLICLNLFQTWQFREGIITKETMSKAYYFASFGKTAVTEAEKRLLLVDRSVDGVETFNNRDGYKVKVIYNNDFKELAEISPSGDSSGVLVMSEIVPYSPGPNLAFRELTKNDHAWLIASVDIFVPLDYSGTWPLLIVTFNHKNQAYKYRSSETLFTGWKKGEWNHVVIDYLTPEVRSENDNLMIYVWHREKEPIAIDNLKLDVWEMEK